MTVARFLAVRYLLKLCMCSSTHTDQGLFGLTHNQGYINQILVSSRVASTIFKMEVANRRTTHENEKCVLLEWFSSTCTTIG